MRKIEYVIGAYVPSIGLVRWFKRLENPCLSLTESSIETVPFESIAKNFPSREEAIQYRDDHLKESLVERLLPFGRGIGHHLQHHSIEYPPENWKIYPYVA